MRWHVSAALLFAGGLAWAEPAAKPQVNFPTVHATTATVSTTTWRTVPHAPFQNGEYLRFVLSWGVVKAGYATLEIPKVDLVAERPAYHIVSTARSVGLADTIYRVRDRNDAWLDRDSLTTVRWERNIREGKYRIEEKGTIDQMKRRFALQAYRADKKRFVEKSGDTTPDILDVLGSLYYVRTLPLEVGQSYTMDVLSSEKVWPLLVKVRRKEKVKVPAGKFRAILVEPVMREPGIFVSKGKKLEVWLTDDERRMPIKMRSEVVIGHVSAELVATTPDPETE